MASHKYEPLYDLTAIKREPVVMTLLPPLSDEEREEVARRREDEQREARLLEQLSRAMQAIEEAQHLLRFPLDGVRLDSDESR